MALTRVRFAVPVRLWSPSKAHMKTLKLQKSSLLPVLVLVSASGVWACGGSKGSEPSSPEPARPEQRASKADEAGRVPLDRDFDRVRLGDALNAKISVGPEFRLKVTGLDDRQLLETSVIGRRLRLRCPGEACEDAELELQLPSLRDLDVGGSARVEVVGLESGKFSLEAEGAAQVELAGTVERFDLEASGAARVRAGALKAERVRAELSGAAIVEVHAAEALDARASGASRLEYSGQPSDLKREVSGAAKVSPG